MIIANSRYYNSTDEIYHQALAFCLFYSVIELITVYFSSHDITWRGEKVAVKYFNKNDTAFLSLFLDYSRGPNLGDKMKYYQQLFERIFFGEYQKWPDDFVVTVSKSNQNQYEPKLARF